MSQEQELVRTERDYYPAPPRESGVASITSQLTDLIRVYADYYALTPAEAVSMIQIECKNITFAGRSYPQDAAVRMLMEHPNWDRKLRRAIITPPTIRTIIHWRVEMWDKAGWPNGYRHVAVIVLPNGACYWAQATFPGSPYNRRIQRLRAVGRALKRCAIATLNGKEHPLADFRVDCELTGRELYDGVRDAVAAAR